MLPNLRRLELRGGYGSDVVDVLSLPLPVRLPGSCSVVLAGTLRLVSLPADTPNVCGEWSSALVYAEALLDALLEAGARSLTLELSRELPVVWAPRSRQPVRGLTNAEQLLAALTACTTRASHYSQLQVFCCSEEAAVVRLAIEHRLLQTDW